MEFEVIESFLLTDRGTAIVIGGCPEALVGSPIKVVSETSNKILFAGQAYKE
jgi:hypothetical protein